MWVSTMLVRGSNLRPVQQQELQQLELQRQKLDPALAALHGALQPIESEVAVSQPRLFAAAHRRSPRQGADARAELLHRERLDQVVVAAALQPFHAVADRAHRGEKQHRGLHLALPQRGDQRQPVEAGQHTIDHQHVERFAPRPFQANVSRLGHVHVEAGGRQAIAHIVGSLKIVFHDEDAHGDTTILPGARHHGPVMARAEAVQANRTRRKLKAGQVLRNLNVSAAALSPSETV
jgi:hypothetical protein